jgi:4-amino-4-deoxy-L-arabinose transferase-like glycosyltransferase
MNVVMATQDPLPYQIVDFPAAEAAPNYRLSLLCILLTKAALMVYVIFHAGIGLGPDEAQYWTWSQHLDWSYYSKPPGIAWQIFVGTYFFGNTEFGVRFGALVIGFLLPLATYFLARRCGLRSATAFWAGTAMALSPLGILASLLATTDGGYVLFWTLGLGFIVAAYKNETTPNYVLVGLCVLCGALFKWTAFSLWVVVFTLAYLYPQWRSPRMIIGIVISLLAFVPSVIWNQSHDWATFRHVWSHNMVGERSSLIPFSGNFFDFLGAQFALFSPVLAVLLILAYITIWKEKDKVPRGIVCCGYVSAAIFAVYLFLSLFKKMQGNWCVYAYPPAIVCVCWYACDWLFRGVS